MDVSLNPIDLGYLEDARQKLLFQEPFQAKSETSSPQQNLVTRKLFRLATVEPRLCSAIHSNLMVQILQNGRTFTKKN